MEATQPTTAPHVSERIKVADHTDRARAMMETAKAMAQTANRLAPLYAEMGLGVYDLAAFTDALTAGGAEARAQFISKAEEEAQNLTSHAIRAALMDAAKAQTPRYCSEAEKVRKTTDRADLKLLPYLAFADGVCSLADGAEEAIKEEAAVWITDPEEIAKYHQHRAIVDALNAFFQTSEMSLPPFWFNLFPIWDGKFIMPLNGSDYSRFTLGHKEAEERAAQESADTNAPTSTPTPPKQNNRAKAGGVVRGIRKEPDYTDHGAARRGMKDQAEPTAPPAAETRRHGNNTTQKPPTEK